MSGNSRAFARKHRVIAVRYYRSAMNSSATSFELPLFPLNTVLFPGGPLALRIFEPRYLSMIGHCVQHGSSFGVCLIREGSEVGDAAVPHEIGTIARIRDWQPAGEGVLGITVEGGARFSVEQTRAADDKLLVAMVTLLPEDPLLHLPPEFTPFGALARRLMERAGPAYAGLPRHYEDAAWVSYRLAELCPLEAAQRQSLLEIPGPLQRLSRLQRMIRELVPPAE
jgi:hypothetical protein